MPMNRALYPDNWDEIARQIKDEAKWTCEECGRPCLQPGQDIDDFIATIQTARVSECPVVSEFLEHPKRWQLTVAHLDHRPENCDRANLKALCNPCHCRYDLKQIERKRMLKREREGQLDIFSYQPLPEAPPEPPLPSAATPSLYSPARIDWWEGQAAFYLKLMSRFLRADAISPQAVRRHEITRLHQLRAEALAKANTLRQEHST